MPQLSLYIDGEILSKIEIAAKIEKLSLSKWVVSVDAPALIPTMTAQFLLNSLYHWNEFARYYVFFGQYVYLL